MSDKPDWLQWPIDEDDRKRLHDISEFVRKTWRGQTGPPYHTAHDYSHSKQVAIAMQQLIPEPDKTDLMPEERFLALAAAWLHDIGMIVNLFDNGEESEKVRDEHHDRSRRFIDEHYDDLGLSSTEARTVGELAFYHRKQEDITECGEYGEAYVRMRLLAAYLRLADAISITKSRVEENEGVFSLLREVGMSADHSFHWVKSFYVNLVKPIPEKKSIQVFFDQREPVKEEINKLAKIICDEIRDELFTVQDVILHGSLPHYLDVVDKYTSYGGSSPGRYDVHLQQLLGNIDLHWGNPASDVATTLINSVLALTKLKDPKDAYGSVWDYVNSVVKPVCYERSCHLLLQKVRDIVEAHTAKNPEEVPDHTVAVNELGKELRCFRAERHRKVDQLVENARSLLMDEGSILLFGCSTLVLRALGAITSEAKEKTPVYVLECRGKSRINLRGEVVYCDGEEYAIGVRNAGFLEVYLVPDIAAANLMANGRIDKVIFGANGIRTKDGTFGHTAGHRTVAELAQVHGVPVYVVADSDKIGEFTPATDRMRDEAWLGTDQTSRSRLQREGVKLLNPREDVVEAGMIRMLITDLGVFPPDRIPRRVK